MVEESPAVSNNFKTARIVHKSDIHDLMRNSIGKLETEEVDV